jgi:FG-GAP-like repeat
VLLTNAGGGTFKDDSALLPKEPFYALTTAAWIDQDGDGKHDILLANGYLGLRLYRNLGTAKTPAKVAFEDLSEKVGLGRSGIAAGLKGYHLAVGDVDGDGRADFLYGAGTGLLVKNTPGGFVLAKDCGLSFKASRIAPVLADFDGDKALDVTLVDGNQIRLFKNDGKGKFTDTTGQRGDLAKPVENAACLVWTDFDNSGRLDLMVGVMKGPNRLFRNSGDGKFVDASEAVGLTQKVFNTRAIAVVDFNNDKAPDVVFNNEGQESAVMLGDPKRFEKKQQAMAN